jgi:hypothetical protein
MKRRIVPGGILALSLAVAVLAAAASTASAATEYHFKLFEKQSFQGLTGDKGDVFRYKGGMFDPQNRDNRVGSDRGKCKIVRTDAVARCKGTVHLNGEIGGSGDIEYGGTWRRGVDTFDVVGGSDDFAGATGETGFRNLVKRGRPDERFWPRLMTTWDLVVP